MLLKSSARSSFKNNELCTKLAESEAALVSTPTENLNAKEIAAINDAITTIHKLREVLRCPDTPGTVDILSDKVGAEGTPR